MRQLALALVFLASLCTTAVAGGHKKVDLSKLACSGTKSCIAKCSVKNAGACDRLADLLDSDLESFRRTTMPGGSVGLAGYTSARVELGPVCDAGKRRACVLLGRLEEQGLGGATDVASAKIRFETACTGGEPRGCRALGHAQGAGTIAASDDGLDAYTRACKGGDKDACADAAEVGLNDASGQAKIVAACDAGSGKACNDAATVYHEGIAGTTVDLALAEQYFRKGCDLGDGYGCTQLQDPDYAAGCYQDPTATSCSLAASREVEDKTKADFLDRACRLGEGFSCGEHADLYKEKYDRKSKAIVAADRVRECDAGDDWICVALVADDMPGVQFGEAMPSKVSAAAKKKATKAIARLDTMCADGTSEACRLVGVVYQTGVYAAIDLPRALAAMTSYCTLGKVDPCYDVETIRLQIASAADQKACGTGDLAGCESFGRGYYGDEKSRTAALKQACDGKLATACAALAYDAAQGGDATAIATVLASCHSGAKADCEFVVGLDPVPATAKIDAERQGCTLGSASLCLVTATDAGNDDDALTAYTRACELDAASTGCAERDRLSAAKQIRDDDAGCAKQDGAACLRVGDRKASTVPAEAIAAYTTACHAQTPGACARAAPYLRPAGQDKGTPAYRDLLDRGCQQGDASMCDEAKYGYGNAPPVDPADVPAETTPTRSYDREPRQKHVGATGRIEGGYGASSRTGQSGVSAYTGGIELRGRTLGKRGVVALLRGSVAYDAQKQIGYDAAVGLGVHYALGPFHLQALGVGGRDQAGAGLTADPAVFGVPPASYVGVELGSTVYAGRWGLGFDWDKLLRGGQPDETRFELTLDRRGSATIGAGLRVTRYDDDAKSSSLGFFGYVGW